jgi:hypothetical protein
MSTWKIPVEWLAVVIVVVLVVIMLVTRGDEHAVSIGVGLIVLVVVWLGYYYWGRNTALGDGGFLGLGQLVEGADGRPSTSKLQFVAWTAVVVFSWIAVYTSRVRHGDWQSVPDLPQNVLIAMGLSVVTVTAAKGITVGYVMSQGQKSKTSVDPTTSSPSAVFQDDTGFPDLSKIQMLVWTLIAIGTYILTVWQLIGTFSTSTLACSASPSPCGLPDIDGALMVLMGLGQGAYLGKKLIMAGPAPRLFKLAPLYANPKTTINVYGSSFGQKPDGSTITIDGVPIAAAAQSWTDSQITFVLPDQHPNGQAWQASQVVQLGVTVGGQDSANTLPITVQIASTATPGTVADPTATVQGAAATQPTAPA